MSNTARWPSLMGGTAPWTLKRNQLIMPDTVLLDYICVGSEKDIPHLMGKEIPALG